MHEGFWLAANLGNDLTGHRKPRQPRCSKGRPDIRTFGNGNPPVENIGKKLHPESAARTAAHHQQFRNPCAPLLQNILAIQKGQGNTFKYRQRQVLLACPAAGRGTPPAPKGRYAACAHR